MNTFSDIFEKHLDHLEQEDAKIQKEEKERQRIQSIGNVFKSMANLYFTTKGAPSIKPKPTTNQPRADNRSRLKQMLDAYETLARLKIADARAQADLEYKQARQESEQRRTDADIQYKQARQENETRKTNAQIDSINQTSSNKELVAKTRIQQKKTKKKKKRTPRKVSLQTLRRRLRKR